MRLQVGSCADHLQSRLSEETLPSAPTATGWRPWIIRGARSRSGSRKAGRWSGRFVGPEISSTRSHSVATDAASLPTPITRFFSGRRQAACYFGVIGDLATGDL